MSAIKSCIFIGLGLWVGGLSLWMGVIAPVSFRLLGREEAGRILNALFPPVDRWLMTWAIVSAGSLFFYFLNRHFTPRSLVLELPVALMFCLNYYTAVVLHPQVRDLRRRLNLPEFQNTSHLEKIRFAFDRLHRRSVQLHAVILFLGWLTLGLVPTFLR